MKSSLQLSLLLLNYLAQVECSSRSCQPRDSVESRLKSVSDSTHLRCLDSTDCPGRATYVFFHNNSITGEPALVHQGSHEYTFTINTLDDAGEYCCVKKCADSIVSISDCKCYWNVKVPPVILQWNITDNSSGSINGSCTATSNPRSLLIVTIPSQPHYDYQTYPIIINRYTTRVEFEISHVTQDCQVDIYCFAMNYPQNLPEKKTFNITTETSTVPNDDVKPSNRNVTIPVEFPTTTNEPANSTSSTVFQTNGNTSVICNNVNLFCKNAANRTNIEKFLLCASIALALYWS